MESTNYISTFYGHLDAVLAENNLTRNKLNSLMNKPIHSNDEADFLLMIMDEAEFRTNAAIDK